MRNFSFCCCNIRQAFGSKKGSCKASDGHSDSFEKTAYFLPNHAVWVMPINGVIPAIGKHIAAGNALSCGNKSVRANKPPELRAIVPTVEVIQPRLGIVVVAPVAEWILFTHGVAAGIGDGALAPGIVAVPGHHLSRSGPDDGDDIPLHVVEIIIQRVAVGEAHPLARAVVEEQHGGIPGLLGQDLAAVEEKLRLGAVHCLGRADAVGVVLVAIGVAAVSDFPQLPALPAIGGAVVGEHVAEVTDNAILCGEISPADNCVVFFYF